MYDQGLIVEINNIRYFANFKYILKPEFYDQLTYVGTSTYEAFNDVCSETMIGVV